MPESISIRGTPQDITKNDGPRALTLTNLMLAWCFLAPFAGATGVSKAGKCGAPGFTIALAVGLPVGFGFAYLMWRGFRAIVTHLSETQSCGIGMLIIIAAFLWIGVAGFVGGWVEEVCFPKQAAYLKACRANHTCFTSQSSTRN